MTARQFQEHCYESYRNKRYVYYGRPPQDRMPIQTYVMEYNDEIVREAINRELLRNGRLLCI